MASADLGLRAAAIALAAVALFACGSTGSDASDSGALALDGSLEPDGAAGDGDGDGDGDAHGDGDGDGDVHGDGDGDGDPNGDGDGDGDSVDAGVVDMQDASIDSDASSDVADAATDATLPALEDLPYAREVVSFTPGGSAGFGQAMFPDIVFGPPKSRGNNAGSLDVLSLGVGGEIVIGFGELAIVDGDGDDFIVFENAFVANGMTFMELGEVAVSEDGETWHTFACDEAGTNDEHAGCAGWLPTLRYDAQLVFPLDPELTGGNAFDLADVGVASARYLRIRDLETQPGSANTGGFDLDAIGLVHYETTE